MKTQRALFSIAVAIVAATLGADAPGAEESGTVLSPQALQEIAQVEAEIDRIEAQAIERLAVPPDNQVQQIELLGKLMLYDKKRTSLTTSLMSRRIFSDVVFLESARSRAITSPASFAESIIRSTALRTSSS